MKKMSVAVLMHLFAIVVMIILIFSGFAAIGAADEVSLTLEGSYDTAGYALNVVVSGNHAYIADGSNGLLIFDISNPSIPILIGSYDTAGRAYAIALSENYAYIADDTSGLVIIDISNPTTPTLVGSYDTAGSAQSVAISGNYAYVADYNNDLVIIDISDPASPTMAGSYVMPSHAEGIIISDNYAYVAYHQDGLVIFDISNPIAPTLVKRYFTSGDALGITLSGNYVYIGDWEAGLVIFDISNPSTPILVGSYNTAGRAYRVAISGDYAFVADERNGVVVVDISNPGSPSLAASYDTTGDYTNGVAVSGNYAYVADGDKGILILNIVQSGSTPPQDTTPPSILISSPPSGQSFDTDTLTVIGTASDDSGLSKIEVKVGTGSWQLASGTSSWSKQVTLSSGSNTITARATDTSGNTNEALVIVSYTPSTGTITISSAPSGASIYLDGSYKGTAPTVLNNIPVGSHTVKLTKSGYNDISRTVTVLSGRTVYVSETLDVQKDKGSISVSSNPSGASIYLDGSPKGKTPKDITDVSIGSHYIELKLDGYKSWSDTIDMLTGSTSYVSVTLTLTTPAPTLDTSPPSISLSTHIVDFNKNGQLEEGEKLVITFGANDESGVKSIKVLVDGNLIDLRNRQGTYLVTTDSISMGDHSIVVEAIDSKGNKISEKMNITAARLGPSVYFPKSRYEVEEGDDFKVVLSAVNPIGNPKMEVLLIIKPPSNGVSTYDSDCKGLSGQCTGKFEIEPGDSVRSVSTRMRADKAGEYQIDAEVYYQFDGGQRSPTRYETLTLVVKPKQTPTPVPTETETPGFEGGIAIIGLLFVALLIKKRCI